MPLEIRELYRGKLIVVHITGKLQVADYNNFAPVVEQAIEAHRKISLVVEMTDFKGWGLGALWEDIKFDARHFGDFERIAMIGEKQWEAAMAFFCKPFTSADVRFFDHAHVQEAIAWASAAPAMRPKGNVPAQE